MLNFGIKLIIFTVFLVLIFCDIVLWDEEGGGKVERKGENFKLLDRFKFILMFYLDIFYFVF